jgi:hypothetical protein
MPDPNPPPPTMLDTRSLSYDAIEEGGEEERLNPPRNLTC